MHTSTSVNLMDDLITLDTAYSWLHLRRFSVPHLGPQMTIYSLTFRHATSSVSLDLKACIPVLLSWIFSQRNHPYSCLTLLGQTFFLEILSLKQVQEPFQYLLLQVKISSIKCFQAIHEFCWCKLLFLYISEESVVLGMMGKRQPLLQEYQPVKLYFLCEWFSFTKEMDIKRFFVLTEVHS